MYSYFISFFIALFMWLFSQVSWAKPSIKSYLPTGVQLGFDLSHPIYNQYKKTGVQYELNGLIDFKKLLLQGDYGWGYIARKNTEQAPNFKSVCKNQGRYFRIGVDYNFIQNSVDDNAAFLGLRYAKSYFKDELQSVLPDELSLLLDKRGYKIRPPWGDYQINSKQEEREVRWIELVAGVRVKAWQWFYIGCTARYQFNKKMLNPYQGHIPFDIIGWGLNEEDRLSLNLYLILRIPLQKRIYTSNIASKEK